MPPIPPSQLPAAAPGRAPGALPQLSTQHLDFLSLYFGDAEHPACLLSEAERRCLPQACQAALDKLAANTLLTGSTRATLEAYYASGYVPQYPRYDLRQAQRLLNAEVHEGIAGLQALMGECIGISDGALVVTLKKAIAGHEKVTKPRLDAIRLVLQLKGYLRDRPTTEVNQATQIIIHAAPGTQAEGTSGHSEEPITLDL